MKPNAPIISSEGSTRGRCCTSSPASSNATTRVVPHAAGWLAWPAISMAMTAAPGVAAWPQSVLTSPPIGTGSFGRRASRGRRWGYDPARTVNENHYAVVVGINRYPGISDLAGPVNDAAAFYGWLVDDTAGGLPPENAWLVEASAAEVHLLEPYDAEPKRWRIDRA